MSNYDFYPQIRPEDKKTIEKYLRSAALSEHTTRGYRWSLRRLARFLAHKRAGYKDLSPELFLEFLDLNDWGENMRAQAQIAARGLIKALYGEEHQIFELAVRKPDPSPQRTLNFDEVKALLSSINLNKPIGVRNYSLVLLMLDTGLRASDVCNLALKHVDLDNYSLQTLIKGGWWGSAVYTKESADALLDWLTIREECAPANVRNVYVEIGGTTPGQPITTSGLRNIFRKMGKTAGLEGLSPHVMRRTFATLSILMGAPTRTVQIAGRWKDLKQVERYTQALEQRAITNYLPTAQIFRNSDED